MRNRLLRRTLAVLVLCPAGAAMAAPQPAYDEKDPEAPAVAWSLEPAAMAAIRGEFLDRTRAAFLDQTGRTPLPATDFSFPRGFIDVFEGDINGLISLGAQAAYVKLGRGPEDVGTYSDMVVYVAARLGIDPPESALALYRDRVRPPDRALTPQQEQGFSELIEAVHAPAFSRRVLYVEDIFGKTGTSAAGVRPAAGRGRKRRRTVAPPPEPGGPPRSVLDMIDWKRADELAEAAAEGAVGWNRSTRRSRRGRCYQWVRMALQKTGLWTDDYRTEVTSRGDKRRPRRAYSFAWAMNKMEASGNDPFAERKAPLRRLDLRIDPLVKGSIVVFDRKVCGFDARSGHIEVISSIAPLRASSYKFHEVKLDCLARAANAGQVHIYVPQRLDLYPAQEPAESEAPAAGPGEPAAEPEAPAPAGAAGL